LYSYLLHIGLYLLVIGGDDLNNHDTYNVELISLNDPVPDRYRKLNNFPDLLVASDAVGASLKLYKGMSSPPPPASF
jgi:hypothetical protein